VGQGKRFQERSSGILFIHALPINVRTVRSKHSAEAPTKGFLSVKVYDFTGREVMTLMQGYKSADFYSVEFEEAVYLREFIFIGLKLPVIMEIIRRLKSWCW
jgi:hypothetical protein